jgi:hypothetical protein
VASLTVVCVLFFLPSSPAWPARLIDLYLSQSLPYFPLIDSIAGKKAESRFCPVLIHVFLGFHLLVFGWKMSPLCCSRFVMWQRWSISEFVDWLQGRGGAPMAEMVGPRVYSCCHCRNHVCLHDDIISKAFQVKEEGELLGDSRFGPSSSVTVVLGCLFLFWVSYICHQSRSEEFP